ncbi:MAG: DUF3793 family protein [Christensenellales bacterium]
MNQSFEWLLANHCAPVLFCKKPAALLAEKALPADCPWAEVCRRGFGVLRLCWCKKTALTLLYHPSLLANTLTGEQTMRELSALGYPVEQGLVEMLRFLRKRFDESYDFPHEVGFFLGYPPEDVIGFMEQKSACKLSGPWKVFGDAERAAAMFEEHDLCKRALITFLENGGSVLAENLPITAV